MLTFFFKKERKKKTRERGRMQKRYFWMGNEQEKQETQLFWVNMAMVCMCAYDDAQENS